MSRFLYNSIITYRSCIVKFPLRKGIKKERLRTVPQCETHKQSYPNHKNCTHPKTFPVEKFLGKGSGEPFFQKGFPR